MNWRRPISELRAWLDNFESTDSVWVCEEFDPTTGRTTKSVVVVAVDRPHSGHDGRDLIYADYEWHSYADEAHKDTRPSGVRKAAGQ